MNLERDPDCPSQLPRYVTTYVRGEVAFMRVGDSSQVVTSTGLKDIDDLTDDDVPPPNAEVYRAARFLDAYCWPSGRVRSSRPTVESLAELASAWWDGADVSEAAILAAAFASGLYSISPDGSVVLTKVGLDVGCDEAALTDYLREGGDVVCGYVPNPWL